MGANAERLSSNEIVCSKRRCMNSIVGTGQVVAVRPNLSEFTTPLKHDLGVRAGVNALIGLGIYLRRPLRIPVHRSALQLSGADSVPHHAIVRFIKFMTVELDRVEHVSWFALLRLVGTLY